MIVGLGVPLSQEQVSRLQEVAPGVEFRDFSDLMRTNHMLTTRGGTPEETHDLRMRMVDAFAEIEVLFSGGLPQEIVEVAHRLEWVQFLNTGIDDKIPRSLWESQIVLTTVAGAPAHAIAEYVLMAMLLFAKKLPAFIAQQKDHVWQNKRLNTAELKAKTVGIVGFGHIGQQVATFSSVFDMHVIATRRSLVKRQHNTNGAALLLPPQELTTLLNESDYVVLAVPLTQETRGLIGQVQLKQMKPSAVLINVGRGALVDESALVQAIQKKWIAGAVLDVFDPEPLSADSPLWDLPNVIITPHVSGSVDVYMDRAVDIVCQNLSRYMSGQPLLNVVNKKMGY
jgi:D-2-hydroxyacid dehydrogenase (NADP+)